jgi:hypothetical protein
MTRPGEPPLLVKITAQQLRDQLREDPGAFEAAVDRLVLASGPDTDTGRFWLAVKEFARRASDK